MKIGIAFDLVPELRPMEGPDDRYEEFDKPSTIEALAGVLRGEGHEVVLLGDGRGLLARVLDDPPDFVWNLAEGEGSGRSREARVPAVLEMLGIPYSGSDPLTLAAALDKDVAKRLVAGGAVVVPKGLALAPGLSDDQVEDSLTRLGFRQGEHTLILKPAFEGSSKGIRGRCVTDSFAEAVALYQGLARDYVQTILVEEFIAGEEVTVGLVGNGEDVEVIGVMRIRPKSGDGRFVYSIEVKRDWDDRVEYETPAPLPAEVVARVERAALAAYARLGCRDLARIDFRVREGIPYFLEANPLPGLAPEWSDLTILARGMGLAYPDLIRRVLSESLRRVGLSGVATPGARR